MAGQALYRKWRSKTFAEIIGQEHVTATLLNALRSGRTAHAYLFTGPRGTGKTTTARVLAKAVNCLDPQNGEPCNRCAICRNLNEGRSLDLIEIDGASNRGIDEIRDLREKIAFSPGESHYKVYVIDEVHMLTDPAFNALLKTLEEPPPHAIFILATTEPHRIPLTVSSRCQRFDFRRVALPNLRSKLDRICREEKVRVHPAALDAIARHATGSFRDAESLLDQLISYGGEEIGLEDVQRVLGAAPQEVISGIVESVAGRDTGAGLRWIGQAIDGGVEPRQLAREVLEHLRGLLLLKTGGQALLNSTAEGVNEAAAQAEMFPLRRLLDTVRLFNAAGNYLKSGPHGQLPLELALVEAILLDAPDNPPGTQTPVPVRLAEAPKTQKPQAQGAGSEASNEPATVSATPEASNSLMKPAETPIPSPNPGEASTGQMVVGSELSVAWMRDNWGSLLQAVRPRSRSVEALLKSCEPTEVRDDVVTLGFYHSFHKERMDDDKNRSVVEEALAALAGRAYRVKSMLYVGDGRAKEMETEASRRERLLGNPVVSEAIHRYGAKVVDVQ